MFEHPYKKPLQNPRYSLSKATLSGEQRTAQRKCTIYDASATGTTCFSFYAGTKALLWRRTSEKDAVRRLDKFLLAGAVV